MGPVDKLGVSIIVSTGDMVFLIQMCETLNLGLVLPTLLMFYMLVNHIPSVILGMN